MTGPDPTPPPAAPARRARVALRLPAQAARLLPRVPAVNAECRALTAAYTRTVAPLLTGARFTQRLLPWAVKGGLLVLHYGRLCEVPADPAVAVLAGAFTRLYDDALDEAAHVPGDTALDRLVSRPATAAVPLPPRSATTVDTAAALFGALRDRVPPAGHPVAYAALPRLHAAQAASLRPVAPRTGTAHLLDAARHKGGLGMLVLGGLVQPEPTAAQQDALLALGGFLQLVDDYEDRAADARAGLETAATRGALTCRLLHTELRAVEARFTALYGPRRTRGLVDELACWVHLTALTRFARGHRPPPPAAGPGRAPTVTALFTRREVIR